MNQKDFGGSIHLLEESMNHKRSVSQMNVFSLKKQLILTVTRRSMTYFVKLKIAIPVLLMAMH